MFSFSIFIVRLNFQLIKHALSYIWMADFNLNSHERNIC